MTKQPKTVALGNNKAFVMTIGTDQTAVKIASGDGTTAKDQKPDVPYSGSSLDTIASKQNMGNSSINESIDVRSSMDAKSTK